jgi:hypothetical protein
MHQPNFVLPFNNRKTVFVLQTLMVTQKMN